LDKLHEIYSSPITDSKNVKEYEDTYQEELCSPCQTDLEYEDYTITRELTSSLHELREENKSLKNELMKQKESVQIF
jgi:hypothetical protein